MARDKMGKEQKIQGRDLDLHSAKNQSQALQRQLLEQQIAENAVRKEVLVPTPFWLTFEILMQYAGYACALGKTGTAR
jgi:hypothetical protein